MKGGMLASSAQEKQIFGFYYTLLNYLKIKELALNKMLNYK